MPVRWSIGHPKQCMLSVFAIARHARAKIGQRTSGKNKSNRQRLPLEIGGANRLSQFICEMILGKFVADLKRIYITHDAKGTFGGKLVCTGRIRPRPPRRSTRVRRGRDSVRA